MNVDISWKYISEKSPWWRGFFERIIGIIKNCLKKVIWKSCLRYYGVETVLVETEHTLNSHLLTYMSEENYAESITPHHLLYGRDVNRKNSYINYFIASDARKQLSNLQQIVSHINKRFYNEYILALRERHHYERQSHHLHLQNVSVGDIVLVKDVNIPRLCWKKGRITKLIKGNDGLVRGVTKCSALIVRYNILYPLNLKIFNNRIKTSKLLIMLTVNPPSDMMNQGLDVLQQ